LFIINQLYSNSNFTSKCAGQYFYRHWKMYRLWTVHDGLSNRCDCHWRTHLIAGSIIRFAR